MTIFERRMNFYSATRNTIYSKVFPIFLFVVGLVTVMESGESFATGRSIDVIAYDQSIEGFIDAGCTTTLFVAANSTTCASGAWLAYDMYANVTLINISKTEKQTGTLEIKASSTLTGILVHTALPAYNGLTKKLFICGDGSTGNTANISANVPLTSPLGLEYSVAPESRVTLQLQFAVYGQVQSANRWLTQKFLPIIKILVDQDQGALLGSFTAYQQPRSDNRWTMCDGTSPGLGVNAVSGFTNLVGYPSTGIEAMNNPRIPLLINGGRPF